MALSAGTAFVDVQPKVGAGFGSTLASKLGPLGGPAGIALGAGIAAGVGGIVALKNIGDTFDDAFDVIRVGTGATGEALAGLQADFKATLTSVPTDAATAAAAIADLNTRTGAVGPTLQNLAADVLELGRISGEDTSALIEKTTRVFGDWGIGMEDSSDALDLLFRASQATGPSVSRLADLVVKFGAPLRQFGFSLDESAALLGKFEKEGVNTELVMGSLRLALGNLAKAGKDPAKEFPLIIEQIKNAGSAAERNALAMEIFGARAGPDMAAAIAEGKFEIGELFDQVASGDETIQTAAGATSDYRESWTKLKNQVFVAIQPLATKFLEILGRLFDVIGPKVQPVIDLIGKAFGFIGDLFGGLTGGAEDAEGSLTSSLGGIGDVFATLGGIFGQVFEVVKVVFGALQAFWDEWGGTIMRIFEFTFGNLVTILTAAFDIITGIFDVVLGILTGDWSRAWEGIKQILGAAVGAVIGIVRNVFGLIVGIAGDVIGKFTSAIGSGIETVLTFFRELPGKVFGFLSSLPGDFFKLAGDIIAGLIRGLGNIAGLVGDAIKGGISTAIKNVGSFFGIGSPSKVMAAEIGLPLAEGVALGAEETADLTSTVLVAGIEDAAKAAAAAVPRLSVGNLADFRASAPGAGGIAGAGLAAGAGTGGDTIGINLEDGAIQVFNPEPEPASLTIPRELRRVATTLGKG
jgi:TP901 family phage tail tape measure protein